MDIPRSKRLWSALGIAALLGASTVLAAPSAHAQSCTGVPGYAKFTDSRGASVWIEDARCGTDGTRLEPRAVPPMQNIGDDGCLEGFVGDVACDREGEDRTAFLPPPPPPQPRMVQQKVIMPIGYRVIWVPAPVASGGGGSPNTGTVSVGPLSSVKEETDTDEK